MVISYAGMGEIGYPFDILNLLVNEVDLICFLIHVLDDSTLVLTLD